MRARRPLAFRLARTVLLMVFTGSLLGVGYFFLKGREGVEEASPSAGEAVSLGQDDEFDVASEGFRYVATEEGSAIFEISGKTQRSDADNTYLEGVEVHMAKERGGFNLRSRKAQFNRSTNEARLEGEVVVEGPDQLTIYSEWLELQQGGRLLVASRGSTFELGPRLVGRSDTFRIDFELDRASLGGGVLVTTRQGLDNPFGLRAERVELLHGLRRVEARSEARLAATWGMLEAHDMNLDLDEKNRVRFLSAQWSVRGWFVPSELAPIEISDATAATSTVTHSPAAPEVPELAELWQRQPPDARNELRGISLSVEVEPATEQPRFLDLDGLYLRRPAVLVTFNADGTRRRLQAVEVQATFEQGRLSNAEARGPVRVAELDGEEEQRVGEGDNAKLLFTSAGGVVSMELEGHVLLEEEELRAHGERAILDDAQDRMRLSGDATVVSPRGTLVAPLLDYDRKVGVLRASGGVRTLLDSEQGERLGGVVLGGAEGPIRVQSDQAVLQRDSGEVVFLGQVRAWQQANRLLTDQLRADEDSGRLSASGNVKTVWHPSDPAEEDNEDEPPPPVEILSELLTYDRDLGELRYQKAVQLSQSGRQVSCDDLDISLDESGAAQQMVCQGHATLYDPVLKRRARGERAVYFPDGGEIRLEGSPVELEDPQKGILRGNPLWYRLDDGSWTLGERDRPAPSAEP